MKKLSNISRIVIGIGSLLLISAYFLPFWSIYLIAPQYPEGLSMQIWLYQITGQVEIINGLNHYIGMKHINADMFPEFDFLVYIFAAYILLGLIVAISGRWKLLLGYLLLFVAGSVLALADFYKWGYDYGHNLDPQAAIQVPGLSYQPPLIGHKKLLNFDAFSYPDTGGWIIIGVAGLFFIILLAEWYKNRKPSRVTVRHRRTSLVIGAMAALMLSSCTPEPEKIELGKDVCADCKMTIADSRFGGEIITKKGKVFKFDDTHCIANFLKRRGVELSDIHSTLFVDYDDGSKFIEVKDAEFVLSRQLKSPMGGNAAAFRNKQSAEKRSSEIDGSKVTNWATLYNILIK